MFASMRRLFPAALLLTASGALADSPVPGSDVPVREIVTKTAVETPKADGEQLRALTQEIQSLQTEVQKLQTKVSERGLHEVEFLDQTTHPMWP